MRVMIAGGGTGGHVYPGIAIYNALRRLTEVDVLFVGAKTGVERQIFENLGLPYVLVMGRGVRGASLAAKLGSPILFLIGVLRGVREIATFDPDVVIGTGGYASVATVAAAVVCRRRRVLQEQNSVPGAANRLLSRFADLVLLSYAESRRFFGSGIRCTVVGNPLRVKPDGNRDAAFEFFGLNSEIQTVLVVGGSRGARAINDAARSAIRRILSNRTVQFVFLTGAGDCERIKDDLQEFANYVRVLPFLERIDHAYNVADVAVSRAGASAVFELAAYGIPSIFVPYPYAADDHQNRNVSELGDSGAAVVVDNASVDGEALEKLILSLLDDEPRRREMSRLLRSWAPVDADNEAAARISELLGEGGVQAAQIDCGRPSTSSGATVETSTIQTG